MRSREISSVMIIQNLAQIKALFKDTWETIPGNSDTLVYLGGNEAGTHEYISKMLGKATIDKKSSGETRGRQGSSSRNYDVLGRELPYLIVKSSDAHKIHRTGTRSSGRSSGQAAVFNRYSVCPLALQPVSF